jgi:micrococcal nuclease
MKRSIVAVSLSLTLLLLTALVLPCYSSEKATVLRVIDGDTLKVLINGQEESVRLIGIDTPESKANKKGLNDAARSQKDIETIVSLGKEATRHVRSLVKKGDSVDIEFDVQPRDRYGRLLGYVYLSNGTFLNEEIVRAGYASPMTIPPNVKYKDRFLNAFREARENRRGLWK